jgi:hypothetical protein
MPKLFLALLLTSFTVFAQTKISGKISDAKGNPLPGANVFLKNSYDGTSSDANGNYTFQTSDNGETILAVSLIGFETLEKKVILVGQELKMDFTLKEKANELNTVTITAGSFEASDEKKMVMLRPLDIVTTAGASGDIYGAIQTLPGTQPQFESEGLFVRGGDASEAKTFIDGIAVANPYYSSVPDVPQRGRFSPFLFKGTNFSTGGYSAQYGGAMSSALILESQDLPTRSTSTINIMSVGGGGGHTHRWKNTSLGAFANYINLTPYYSLVKQHRDWSAPPSSFSSSIILRQKVAQSGMLKAFANFSYNDLGLNYPDINDISGKTKTHFALNNYNFFSNVSYKDVFAEKWSIYTSGSLSRDNSRLYPGLQRLLFVNNNLNGRLTLARQIGNLSAIRGGFESDIKISNSLFNDSYNTYNRSRVDSNDIYSAGYIESDIYFTKKFMARLGARAEESYLMRNHNIAPRVSLAYKTGTYSQLGFAYGDFYQQPDQKYIYAKSGLSFSKATHYLLNYQHVDDKRTFRIEGYYKDYSKLIRTVPDTNSNGKGYARGFDIFWRDKKTFKYTDYWISYSYLDTKRLYLDYIIKTQPTYAAANVLTIVYKRWVPKINTSISFTYAFATGRPYYNPNKAEDNNFLSDRTKEYHNLSFTASYLTSIGKHFTVVSASIGNVLGIENIYTYNYSYDGERRYAVGPTALRSFFIGMFISIGEDKTDD